MVRWWQIGITALLLIVWEAYTRLVPGTAFYFSSPSRVSLTALAMFRDGTLLGDVAVTVWEALAGFVVGTVLGTVTGVVFWFSPFGRQVAYPFIVALAAVPVFALSPVIIMWFGIGVGSKVALAAIATYFAATFRAYQGVLKSDSRLYDVLIILGGTKQCAFRKAIVPGALWEVIEGAKANVGIALAGAFIGEVISSEAGLGHTIIVAMGLFEMSRVIVGLLLFAAIAVASDLTITRFAPQWAHRAILKL
jgi:NitT/TauT family transport system permease protein